MYYHSNVGFYMFMNSNFSKICYVHCYKTEYEYYNHIPFSKMNEIKESQMISLLLKFSCLWFTMELERQEEQTRQIYLFKKWLNPEHLLISGTILKYIISDLSWILLHNHIFVL